MFAKRNFILIPLVAIGLLLPSVSFAEQGKSTRVRKNDGMNWKERVAVKFVGQRLRLAYPARSHKVSVRPTMVQYPGNKLRPISGNRPVEVEGRAKVKKGNIIKRLFNRMSASANSRWYVQVQKGTLPAVVERLSMTPQAKIGRKLPIREKIHDFFHSKGVRTGAVTGGLGAAVATVSWPVALAAVAYASVEAYKGLDRRNQARGKAIDQTASWARQQMRDGVTPSPVEAFATYKGYLEAAKPGTNAGTFEKFLGGLATHGL